VSDLTATEQTNVRTALRFLRARLGRFENLAKVLHAQPNALRHVVAGRHAVSVSIAYRVARFAKVSVDDVLTGRFPEPGTCAHCGHRAEAVK
jgi:plasmid maintenance system antidote protein VapI